MCKWIYESKCCCCYYLFGMFLLVVLKVVEIIYVVDRYLWYLSFVLVWIMLEIMILK